MKINPGGNLRSIFDLASVTLEDVLGAITTCRWVGRRNRIWFAFTDGANIHSIGKYFWAIYCNRATSFNDCQPVHMSLLEQTKESQETKQRKYRELWHDPVVTVKSFKWSVGSQVLHSTHIPAWTASCETQFAVSETGHGLRNPAMR